MGERVSVCGKMAARVDVLDSAVRHLVTSMVGSIFSESNLRFHQLCKKGLHVNE